MLPLILSSFSPIPFELHLLPTYCSYNVVIQQLRHWHPYISSNGLRTPRPPTLFSTCV